MPNGTSNQMKALVLRNMPLPPAWATPKQIYNSIGIGSYATVKIALHNLAKEGVLAKFGPIMDPAYCRRDILPVKYSPVMVDNVLSFPDRLHKETMDYRDRLRKWKAK